VSFRHSFCHTVKGSRDRSRAQGMLKVEETTYKHYKAQRGLTPSRKRGHCVCSLMNKGKVAVEKTGKTGD
jgi:hypothetical protein